MNYTYETYAEGVLSGNIQAGELIRLACHRYFRDKKRIYEGLTLDRQAGERAIRFISSLKQTKGIYAGHLLALQPWQQFLIFNLFAWKRADGSRRFRKAYIEVARKNGKSTLAAGIGLCGLFVDKEPRAEIYSAATTKDQAKIVFEEAKEMVKSCSLKNRINIFRNSLSYDATGSYFKPLSSDYDTLDGLNPHISIIDEYHAHPTSGVLDVLDSASGSRFNPLMFIITTAGFYRNYPCYAYRRNAINVLRGIAQDDSLFSMIFTLDEGDDWADPSVWIKANPNLDVSVSSDYIGQQVKDALNRPEAQVNVMTKNLNLWTDSAATWILDSKWMESEVKGTDLEHCDCWGGLDLSNVSDITAFVLAFNKDGKTPLLPFFWIPEDTVAEKMKKENVDYRKWINEGHIRVTPGNVVDYAFIKEDILQLSRKYNIRSIAYDRWNSSQTVIDLQNEGMTMHPFGQGYASMSTPTKAFEAGVLSRQVVHDGNPVLRWMLSNVAIARDPSGNIKPDKSKSSQKIDGISAAIMALGEKMSEFKEDVYAHRGIRTL